jgi:hypothetical protein
MRLATSLLVLCVIGCDSGPTRAGSARAPAREVEEREEEAREVEPREPSGPGPTATALPVDGARAMATLSETEIASVCAWMVENAPHRRVECEDGPTLVVGVGRDEGCPPAVAFAGCTLTVGQATSCMAENARDPCAHGMFGATVCAAFGECMLIQMGGVREGPSPPPP